MSRQMGGASPAKENSAGRDRFAARREALEREAILRRRRTVVVLAAVTALVLGAIGFVNSPWFDVNDIKVVGHERADAAEIVAASGILVGDGLLSVDLDEAATLVETVPWVGEARVGRSWRGQVAIAVNERPPAAVIPAGSQFALIDDEGRQLEIVDSRPAGFLPISGVQASGVAGESAPSELLPVVALLQALPPNIEADVIEMQVDEGLITLVLQNGGRVRFGDGSDLAVKLQAVETVLTRVDTRCLESLDVRVPGAPVISRYDNSAADMASSGGLDC